MYNITKVFGFRSRRWLMILLVLISLSLISHYIADAVHISAGTCWSCRIQKISASRQAGESAHTNDLHEHFLLTERSSSGIQPGYQISSVQAIYPSFDWVPSAPVRPPIYM